MNYWIFVATDTANPDFTAEEAYRNRMGHGLWGIGANTPNKRKLSRGDKVVFYLTSPAMAFVGTATISSTVLNKSERDKLCTERVFLGAKSGVKLTYIDVWSEPKEIKPLLEDLHFIKNKERWGTHLQGGIRGISEEDFELITLKTRSN